MPYRLPTDHERRALFAWLKQASSLSAWRRLYTFHQVFVDAVQGAYDEEERTVGMTVTIDTSRFARLLRDHEAFNAAVQRLARGDRSCFTFLGSRGHFSEGLHSVENWNDMLQGLYMGRNGWPPYDSPRWPAIERAMNQCLAALSDIRVVLQDRFTDKPAPVADLDALLALPAPSLFKHWLNQTNLPPVPAAEPVLVRSGADVPCYGIWEPVEMQYATGLFASFRKPPAAPPGGYPIEGCMNYLHGNSDAPSLEFAEDGPENRGRATTWRLLWADERYGTGGVPVDEQSYTFVQPTTAGS